MGLAPSGNGEDPGKSAVAKVPVPIFSQPRSEQREHSLGTRKVVVRVVYFDRGRGQWALRYDAGETTPRTTLVVTNSDSGQWKQALATINDGHFAGGCPHRTDLMLVNLDEEDKVFHMIELLRKTSPGASK
jgi:hypothetical protein